MQSKSLLILNMTAGLFVVFSTIAGTQEKSANVFFAHHSVIMKGDEILAVSWSPDGVKLAAGGTGTTVSVWNAVVGKEPVTFKGHKKWISSLSWSPDNKILASASLDGTVKLWDVSKGKEQATFKGHSGWVTSIAWSPDGKTLASAGNDKSVILWDA